MDYDRNDALLHYLFRQTQGDAWFRPNESSISSGVALRINNVSSSEPEFRIFPYETPSLLPFEEAVRLLNPAVAVKIRSASVHAAMAQALSSSSPSSTPSGSDSPQASSTDSTTITSIYIDTDTRIQVIDTLLSLPLAERDQCAAFIRDERVLIVWSDELDRIVPMCQDFEDRLIKLLWRENLKFGPSTGTRTPSLTGSTPGVSSTSHEGALLVGGGGGGRSRKSSIDGSAENLAPSLSHTHSPSPIPGGSSTPPSSWSNHPHLSPSASGNNPRRRSLPNQPKLPNNASGLRSEIRPDSPQLDEPTSIGHDSIIPPSSAAHHSTAQHSIANSIPKRTWYGKKYFVPSPPTHPTHPSHGNGGGNGSGEPSVSAEDLEKALKEGKQGERKVALYAPVYNGLAAGLSLLIIGNGIRTLLKEYFLDGNVVRFALLITTPFLFCVSLFFSLQMIQNLSMVIGPIEQYHHNSCYYSGSAPRPNRAVDDRLPHVTIQMPVYKEGLEGVLAPSISSVKRAMQTYARQGGTSSIFINDDGLRVIGEEERRKRMEFYRVHGIAWVARPGHGDLGEGGAEVDGSNVEVDEKGKGKAKEGDVEKGVVGENGKKEGKPFHRAGRFKKASNLNYALSLSLKMERHLARLLKEEEEKEGREGERRASGDEVLTPGPFTGLPRVGTGAGSGGSFNDGLPTREPYPGPQAGATRFGLGHSPFSTPSIPSLVPASRGSTPPLPPSNSNAIFTSPSPSPPSSQPTSTQPLSLEDQALQLAISETFLSSSSLHRPWASNARGARIGEIILLVDSDTIVPEDCLRDAAREMGEDERVGIVQHESDVLKVVGHYFENGIAYFTRRVNRCISVACANGEIAPFMGHNAFLRWKAIQDVAFIDPEDGEEKIWSESNVSEDFDMALRLMQKGYIIRWATYSKGGFKEGVSLSVDDELNRWQKYSYGCSELLFNPIAQWWRKGPISKSIHKFVWSDVPIHYKISSLAYMFSYYGIAAGITIAIINYILLGFQFDVDGFYLHSFEIWLSTTVIFFGSGTVGYSVLQYRLGLASFFEAFLETVMWIPFFFFFFGGLSIPLTQAMLAHLFSYNITWSATIKEVERSNFFKEIPKIFKRFWFPLSLSFVLILGMIVVASPAVSIEWRIDGSGWAVIFPVALLAGCHILFPIVLNPWLMVFSY